MIDPTYSFIICSSYIRTANLPGFETVFRMCQDGCILANFGRSGKALHNTNMGNTHTWILLDRQSTINVFYNRKQLADLAHMEISIAIHCNLGIVHTNFSAVIPGNEQETTWYHPQVITNSISLSMASKQFHIIYNSQYGIISCLNKPDGSYHEFRESFRALY